jgi:hypothetical protein
MKDLGRSLVTVLLELQQGAKLTPLKRLLSHQPLPSDDMDIHDQSDSESEPEACPEPA